MESINFGDKQFYVYHHLAPDGTVFYVGMGRGGRAFNNYRNTHWKAFVAALGGKWTCSIIKWCNSKEEALKFEREEILRLKPEVNMPILIHEGRPKSTEKQDAGRKGGFLKWSKIKKKKRSQMMRAVALARWSADKNIATK